VLELPPTAGRDKRTQPFSVLWLLAPEWESTRKGIWYFGFAIQIATVSKLQKGTMVANSTSEIENPAQARGAAAFESAFDSFDVEIPARGAAAFDVEETVRNLSSPRRATSKSSTSKSSTSKTGEQWTRDTRLNDYDSTRARTVVMPERCAPAVNQGRPCR
jgi:hypothetical protein